MGNDEITDDADSGDDVIDASEPPNAGRPDDVGTCEPQNKDAPASEPPKPAEPSKPADPLPSDVEKIMFQHDRVAKLFAGTARGTAPDGQLLKPGTAPGAYDYAFAAALVKYDLRDPNTIATALKLRPDGHAANAGDAYVAGVIARALASADPISGGSGSSKGHAFTIEDVTVFDGDPPVFTLTIKVAGGAAVPITFETMQLLSPVQFVTRCFEKLRKFLALPDDWWKTVEGRMASARVVTPPPDSTRQGSIIRAVRRAIGRLSLGESLPDIRDGRGVLAHQRAKLIVLFEVEAIMASLRAHDAKPVVEEVAQSLLKIGATHGRRTVTINGRSVKTPKCWAIKAPKELAAVAAPVATTGPGGKVIPFAAPNANPQTPPPPGSPAGSAMPANDEDVIV